MFAHAISELAQFADIELVLTIGNILFPDRFELSPHDGRMRVWAESDADAPDDVGRREARAMFQIALGVLRAWKPIAGELAVEVADRLGPGSAMDAAGNQWVGVNTAIVYVNPGEAAALAERARNAIASSQYLDDALWLNGRLGRTASDFWMIHQYATMEFGSKKQVAQALGISINEQDRLTQSASNLPPLEGGRKARSTGAAPWDLSRQSDFIGELLRAWIHHASSPSDAA